MYIKIESCPVCKNRDIKNLMICKDHLNSGESFAINECSNCTVQFTNPRPEDEKLYKYYQSDNYISHANKGTNLVNKIYKLVRNYTLRKKLDIINSLSKSDYILDIGCGTGEFLDLCQDNKWKIAGVEPNKDARAKAEKLTNKTIFEDLFSCNEKSAFKIITLWHVLEHLPDLDKVLSHLKTLLHKKGKIVIAVPNNKSYDAIKYKEHWAAYDVPRHLYHFNQKSIGFLAKKHQLKIKKMLPMKLDAFYVSLLSEKYKNNSSNYIKSFLTGLKSNSYAKRNNNNYSSLIFILKK